MKANKYQKLALRSALLDRSPDNQMVNAVLGLIGESGELCNLLHQSSTDNGDSLTSRYLLLAGRVGELGDIIKKNMFHGHPVDDIRIMNLSREISDLAFKLSEYCTYRDITFDLKISIDDAVRDVIAEEIGDCQWYIALGVYSIGMKLKSIMKQNIDKLLKRYPDKFSSERSINRDRDK